MKSITTKRFRARLKALPRVAMAENGAKSVSLDLLMRVLIATGATSRNIGSAIAGG